MQFLTKSQCEHWMVSAGLKVPTELALTIERRNGNIEKLPAARTYSLLRDCLAKLAPDWHEPILIEVQEYGVWKSSENLLLYSLVRQQFFSTGTVEDTPGHLAEPHEREFVLALAFLFISFGWGFYIISRWGPLSFAVDHDGNWALVETDSKGAGT